MRKFPRFAQFEEFPRFRHGVESVRQIDDTTVHFTTDIAGVRREFDARITAQIPDDTISWEAQTARIIREASRSGP
ncbi:SRPBCC family protein [Arthrobacter sp. M-10]|uniref:SRPBCC family protein n=1 Tax=Arthrobacter sp. M-10 TaxID=3233037 RepID=UPI003F914EB4